MAGFPPSQFMSCSHTGLKALYGLLWMLCPGASAALRHSNNSWRAVVDRRAGRAHGNWCEEVCCGRLLAPATEATTTLTVLGIAPHRPGPILWPGLAACCAWPKQARSQLAASAVLRQQLRTTSSAATAAVPWQLALATPHLRDGVPMVYGIVSPGLDPVGVPLVLVVPLHGHYRAEGQSDEL